MMHDFAITENFAVFLDMPMVLKPERIVMGKIPVVYDSALGSRQAVDTPEIIADCLDFMISGAIVIVYQYHVCVLLLIAVGAANITVFLLFR